MKKKTEKNFLTCIFQVHRVLILRVGQKLKSETEIKNIESLFFIIYKSIKLFTLKSASVATQETGWPLASILVAHNHYHRRVNILHLPFL